MSIIFKRLKSLSSHILNQLEINCNNVNENHGFTWPNYIFENKNIRRAHLDIVDVSETKKLYMVHLCIFPHRNDTSPIFGFDLIAGPNKVTGAFHDFSPGYDKNHIMMEHFANTVYNLSWSKKRELPDWARNIFSKYMVAAGNITDVDELEIIIELVKSNLKYYMSNVGKTINDIDSYPNQNFYCDNQRLNPHTPKVMQSLGFDPPTVNRFINDCLFPSVH